MLSESFSFFVILILLIDVSSASAQLKKVRFSTTGISISELPFKVAQVIDDNWMKGAIEFTQNTLGGAAKEVPLGQVFDFSFVQKTAR